MSEGFIPATDFNLALINVVIYKIIAIGRSTPGYAYRTKPKQAQMMATESLLLYSLGDLINSNGTNFLHRNKNKTTIYSIPLL